MASSYHTFKYSFSKLGLSIAGGIVCKRYLQAFVSDPGHREIIKSEPGVDSDEMTDLAAMFIAEFGPEFWSPVLKRSDYVEGAGLMLPKDRESIMHWVKELLKYQMMSKEPSGSSPAKKRTPMKLCRVSPGALRRAYNDNGEDDDDDDDDDDDEDVDMKADDRTKFMLSAASHTSRLGLGRIKSERAARPASTPSTPSIKTESKETNDSLFNVSTVSSSTAPSTTTSFTALTPPESRGLSEYAIQHTRVYFKLRRSACTRSVSVDSLVAWPLFCAQLIDVCGLEGGEDVTTTAICPWFDSPFPFMVDPGRDLQRWCR
ncbi:MAG: hypothetical protein M1812_005684 [Candelaria pacifica]|nr:MAG: hypothetical protein M1812_005684 [Candelaria pacifica]